MSCPPIKTTDIVFENMAVRIVPPHMPFQKPILIRLTINFGNGTIPTTSYQGLGDNLSDSTIYLQGGGGISINGTSQSYTGCVQLSANIHYAQEPQRLLTEYHGTVKIKESSPDKAVLSADLYAVGQGPLKEYQLKAKLTGDASIVVVCGIKTMTFATSSLSLAVLLPSK